MPTETAIVPIESAGQRVDAVLAQLFPAYSRTRLTAWIKAGLITLDNAPCKPKDRVRGGENISLTLPDPLEQPSETKAQAIPLDIIFEDDALLVINKPAKLVVHPGAGQPDNTLVNALLHHAPKLNALPRAGIVHRLDKDTTGLLLVAKTLPAYTALTAAMQAREINREYLALVKGHIIAGNTIETFYGRDARNRLKMAVKHSGKTAITRYAVEKRYGAFTLLRVTLLTGRTHQIRVHMAHIKHPIIGDPLYGGSPYLPKEASKPLVDTLQSFKRQALHACRLSFDHPLTGETLAFTAPLPDDFQTLLACLNEK